MLKGIPELISPEMIKVLMEMGHGDQLVIADGNFPSYRCGERIVRCDGVSIAKLLDAILRLFPLDAKVHKPVSLMKVNEHEPQPEVWQLYQDIIANHHEKAYEINYIDRFDFYKKAKDAYAIIATTDTSYKGNILIEKGVIR
ncbi:RbsD/FucU family protein [Desertibacillus haloalkaliphilus]|uniref:RbsD/FucU family protein n=1 Tax=Desertibacillus haloalkaliphilus TaxID=1328930 RepID=UPI001C2640E1|nr:RbsD/FucU domain-containing protein [Desertibacillus haloalkaliphilus]MBU8907678.1 fucose isomerase [Desertibacillus haloalkaliphilus]